MTHSNQSSSFICSWLGSTANPKIVRFISCISDARSAWIKDADRKWIELDGRQMRDCSSAYNHLTEAFQLPNYFGRNLNALNECLVDTDVLQGTAYVVCITHASEALLNTNKDALAGLLETFANVANELSESVNDGQLWDRSSIPFHILLTEAGDDERLQKYPLIIESQNRSIHSQ